MSHDCRVRFTPSIVVLLSLFCCGGVRGQADAHHDTSSRNSLENGSWALQFQIADNFTLQEFQGAIISAKRHFSDNVAARIGVSLTLTTSDADNGGTAFQNDTLYSSNTGTHSGDAQSLLITTQYLYYLDPQALVNVFFGGGPLIEWSRSHSERSQMGTSATNYVSTQHYTSDTKSWAVGAAAVTGVEWFATRSLAFHAEYGFSIRYVSTDGTYASSNIYQPPSGPRYSSGSNEDSSGSEWLFSGNSVKFGLSVYF